VSSVYTPKISTTEDLVADSATLVQLKGSEGKWSNPQIENVESSK
jgi:hypothetical protein